ncbi:DNA-binding transcriptional regulator, MarR family [Yoonia rosea]|uniref:DNA-binding transcriptional regulator, MarR family n=1 Tax=Yoonia rosea TaxID=287098 RepID=A0A1R3WGE7_9RHOB|nr:MarR family winged helix-turn-helix transcriptional regulator [Yoonia rosea]SIT76314.1 DNA-binding transcriptional regulator, MarR family [Yoonia rosea]
MNSRFRLSDFLPYRLAVISERISNRLSVDYAASHDLSVAEWRVLVHLQHCGVVSVRDIQHFTNLEKSRVSRAVGRLEKAGLVEKHSSTNDARLIEIILTQTGRDAIKALLTDATQTEARLLKDVPPADMAAFYRVIDHFHSVLDDDPKAKAMPKPPLDSA